MRRLVWAFAGRTYHIVWNLVSRLKWWCKYLLYACWVIFLAFIGICWLFSKLPLSKNSFRNNISVKLFWSRPRGYKSWVHSQTQNKGQWLAACRHMSASSQSLRFILSPRLYSSFITSRPDHDWIFISPDWVQTVFKGYQQTTKVAAGKGRVNVKGMPRW